MDGMRDMREATSEEQVSVDDYIESISEPTGDKFFRDSNSEDE